jgi:iron-sulfur cluster assembly protein
MIILTESAVNAVRTAISGAKSPVEGLRIKVESGGCAGFKYQMGLVTEIDPVDYVVEQDDVRVFVDPDSLPHLEGTTIDFVSSIESSGFAFDNPKAQSSCGCGKSFS